MRFKTKGTVQTENVIDIAQRIVAQLQDAGVGHVAGVNVYLSTVDKRGECRDLAINGKIVDELDVEIDDLRVLPPEESLRFVTDAECGAVKRAYGTRRRR